MEQLITPTKTHFTVEEYLQMEENSPVKHEFVDGEIISMAGGTLDHAVIAGNLVREIGNGLKGTTCLTMGSDLSVLIREKARYFYPDVSVVCDTPIYDPPEKKNRIINPQLVIEVSSTTTETYDRSEKFYDYMRLESLAEYVLVAQDRMRVDTYYRHADGVWAIGPSFTQATESVSFRSLKITIPMTEIYANVTLPPQNPEAPVPAVQP